MSEINRKIHIQKEALKFSAAHMTVFSAKEKENLHGHNYSVEVSIEFSDYQLDKMISFATLKAQMKQICHEWDEKVLLPEKCPHLKVLSKDQTSIEFTLCDQRYLLPIAETLLLPVDNVVTETLSELFCKRFTSALKKETPKEPTLMGIKKIEVRVEEIPGQGASYSENF